MPELLNQNEILTILSATPVTEDHTALLNALRDRYPDTPFQLISEGGRSTWDVGILDKSGNRVTTKLGTWVDQELAAADGSAREVWHRHKDAGLVRTEREGVSLKLTAPYGAGPDAFYQLNLLAGPEIATQNMFDPGYPADDRFDLLSGPCMIFGDAERKILAPAQYKFEGLTNMKRFLRELVEVDKTNKLAELPEAQQKVIRVQHVYPGAEQERTEKFIPFLQQFPDWADRVPPSIRLFQDWQESSAGREGHRFCEHWYIQVNDWVDAKGLRRLSVVPQWAAADGGLNLPEIFPEWEDEDHRSPAYGIMQSLQDFDQQVGYPFAWFFYMVHGNRIGAAAGGIVAKAILAVEMKPLPPHDEVVLLRWADQQYGF